jgi:hypothetical protein
MTGTVHRFPRPSRAEGISRGAAGADAPAVVPGLTDLGRVQARALCIHSLRLLLDHAEAGADCTSTIVEVALTLDELGAPEGPEAA